MARHFTSPHFSSSADCASGVDEEEIKMFDGITASRITILCSLLAIEPAGAIQQLYRCPQQDGTYLFTTEQCVAAQCVVAGSYHATESVMCTENIKNLRGLAEEAQTAAQERFREQEELEARRAADRQLQIAKIRREKHLARLENQARLELEAELERLQKLRHQAEAELEIIEKARKETEASQAYDEDYWIDREEAKLEGLTVERTRLEVELRRLELQKKQIQHDRLTSSEDKAKEKRKKWKRRRKSRQNAKST